MRVFISWSGKQSGQIAEALRAWLPMVIQAAKPYMSARDNEAGVRWEEVITRELSTTDFGILCLTPDNIESPWLNFEAGALGKVMDKARVVPLLYRLSTADVSPPLSMFMMKPADENGVLATITAINENMENSIDPVTLKSIFGAMWPHLQSELAAIEHPGVSLVKPPRPDRELLEEILELLRRRSRVAEPAQSRAMGEAIATVLGKLVDPSGVVEISGKTITVTDGELHRLRGDQREELKALNRIAQSQGLILKLPFNIETFWEPI
jgi:TIR domain